MSTPSINGVGHIDLTVRDGERSVKWWEQVMGFKLVNISEHEGGRKGGEPGPNVSAAGLPSFSYPPQTARNIPRGTPSQAAIFPITKPS